METAKNNYLPFKVGQEITVNGAEMVIVSTDLAGNPVVESKKPASQVETLVTEEWPKVPAGIGAASVKSASVFSA